MRLNRAMEELLRRFRIDPAGPPPLVIELQRLLEPGILSVNGSWLLASQAGTATSASLHQFPDRTGYEAFVNHIHVADALDGTGERPPGFAFRQAIALGRALERLVAAHGAFRIVVAADVDSPGDPNVRFYRSRSGEVWLEDDLESYTHEGILVLETPESDPASTHVH